MSHSFHRPKFSNVRISEDSDLWKGLGPCERLYIHVHTLRAFMFFKSIPTSAVTPSPNLRLDAATFILLSIRRGCQSINSVVHTYLERVLLFHSIRWSGERSQLIESLDLATMRMGSTGAMTWAGGTLRCTNQAKNSVSGGHSRHSNGMSCETELRSSWS